MKFGTLAFFTIFCLISSVPILASKCGCKTLSSCYVEMLNLLHEPGEAFCIEEASIGTSSVTIFLNALKEFCGDVVTVEVGSTTYDKRNLYEVVIDDNNENTEGKEPKPAEEKPTIIIDAGQEGGETSVRFALFIIEQLVACQENKDMIHDVKWVIMPSTNPDGLEYSRYKNTDWRKNLKMDKDEVSFGVDISRNFDSHWSSCTKVTYGFAPDYPGPAPGSEDETTFIKNVVDKHKNSAKIYLSIRRDGHHIGFPNAYTDKEAENKKQYQIITADVAQKVNLRSGGVHSFKNNSIYNLEGKPRCGHSVDWAAATGIQWAFEMRIFLETSNHIMSMFQTLPRGYDNTLRNGYFTAIRELHDVLTNKKKYGNLTMIK